MRVAFQHTDPEHPAHGVAAFAQGRVQDFTHPLSGEQTSADDIMVAFLDRARSAYPKADGYRVWPERLVTDVGLEDCYRCAGKGVIADPCSVCGSAGEDENGKTCPACKGKLVEEGTERECPNCKGAKQTPYAEWREIDEDALRARASGKAVDVPEVSDLPAHQVGAQATQDTDADASED